MICTVCCHISDDSQYLFFSQIGSGAGLGFNVNIAFSGNQNMQGFTSKSYLLRGWCMQGFTSKSYLSGMRGGVYAGVHQ